MLVSSVSDLQAANASALNNKVFNLGGTAGYGQVIVAYSDSASGHTRLATATIAGNDITNIIDLAVLENVTTSQFFSQFHENNIAGFGTPGGNFTITAGTAVNGGAGNDTFTAANTAAFNNATINGGGGLDTIVITSLDGNLTLGNGAAGGTIGAGTTISQITVNGGTGVKTLTLQGGTFANATVTNNDGTNGHTFNLGNNTGVVFNGSAAAETIQLGASNQTVNAGGGNDTVEGGGQTGITIDGGAAGTDVLKLTAAANTTTWTISGVETLDINGNNITLTSAQFNGFTTVNNSGGAATITFADNGAVTHGAGTASKFTLAAGGQSFTGNVDVAYDITGGNGADTITIGAGNTKALTITVNGGGVDTIVYSDNAYAGDKFNMDATDVLLLKAASNDLTGSAFGAGTADPATITLDGGADLKLDPGTAQQGKSVTTINGGTGNNTIEYAAKNQDHAITINIGQGGSDTIILDVTGDDNKLTTINGFQVGALAGGGDVLDLSGTGAGNDVTLQYMSIW